MALCLANSVSEGPNLHIEVRNDRMDFIVNCIFINWYWINWYWIRVTPNTIKDERIEVGKVHKKNISEAKKGKGYKHTVETR